MYDLEDLYNDIQSVTEKKRGTWHYLVQKIINFKTAGSPEPTGTCLIFPINSVLS